MRAEHLRWKKLPMIKIRRTLRREHWPGQ